jgi:hypothetical protein
MGFCGGVSGSARLTLAGLIYSSISPDEARYLEGV